MKVDVRKLDDVVVVDLEARLVAGGDEELLADVVDELLAEGWKKILLNLGGVTRVDSSGVGVLVSSFRKARDQSAELKILRPQEQVERTLHLSQLLPLFEVHSDEGAALASFRHDPDA